ncbi:hypothetical protein MPER_00886, partial [Moniliophthora perniciosa FA553]
LSILTYMLVIVIEGTVTGLILTLSWSPHLAFSISTWRSATREGTITMLIEAVLAGTLLHCAITFLTSFGLSHPSLIEPYPVNGRSFVNAIYVGIGNLSHRLILISIPDGSRDTSWFVQSHLRAKLFLTT